MGPVDVTTRGGSGHPNRIGACSDVQWETLHNLKKLQDTEDRYQVKLENGRILSAEHKNVRPDRAIPIRGATGRKEGMMNKEKAMQKKQRRKINRIKKAIVYWKKRPLTQGTCTYVQSEREGRKGK